MVKNSFEFKNGCIPMDCGAMGGHLTCLTTVQLIFKVTCCALCCVVEPRTPAIYSN